MSRTVLSRLLAGCLAIPLLTVVPGFDRSVSGGRLLAQARERVMYVSMLDSTTQKPVRDLGPDAFVVREDGTRREVLRVTPATTPLPIAIIIDNSQAAAPTIADLRKALTTFVSAIDGAGPVAIVTVADRPTIVTDYTTSQKELLDSVGRLFHVPNSGATLLDAISDVAKGLEKRETDRAAIVVVTTENIDYSHLQYQDVLKAIKSSGVSTHVVVLVNPNGSFSTDEARNRATVLDRGPRESGGVRMDVLTSMSFESRLKDLATILKSQYRVVYARPESLIPPERIEVSAAKPGLEARGIPARGQAK
jgi:VWFA-related protein